MAPRLPRTELTGFRGRLVKTFARRMIGSVPESIEVMWHHPKLVMDSMGVGRKVKSWDEVDEDLKTFAHMAVASLVGCTWCLDYGYFEAHNKGLDLAKAREVPRWRESDVFNPRERRVMEYAEAMCQLPPTVTDEMSAALRDDLGPAGLIELTAHVAFSNMSTRMNVALGIEADGFAAACDLKPLAQPSGRVASVA